MNTFLSLHNFYEVQYVQEVVTHLIYYASYIKWVTTSWTHSITLNLN